MLSKLLPRASSEQLSQVGTDISFDGRFNDTLSYNHFTSKDEVNMATLANLLHSSAEEATDLFYTYVNNVLDNERKSTQRQAVLEYFRIFFHEKRSKQYVDKILPFFNELRLGRYNVGKLIVVFNQIHFLFTTRLLSKKAMFPHQCLELLETLQRALNIDQQILIEVYTENLIETASDGIAQLMGKNSDIMYIKDLLAKLEQQNDLSQNVAAAAEQLAASIDEVARNSIQVAEKTDDVVQETTNGKQIITQALNEIIRSDQIFDQMVASFLQLQRFLSNIQKVVGLIDNIAKETNLLALNASIEAAHAGRAGSGFAVVAGEIRKLANSTTDSLRVVAQNVAEVSQLSDGVSESIFSTQKVIKLGVQEAEKALPLLTNITNQITQVSKATETIASITQEQAAAVNEVTHRMVRNAELTGDAQELSRKTGDAVYELSKITESFRKTLFSNDIKLSTHALLQLAKSDHILWKWRIYNMIMGYETVKPQDVSSHHDCRLGKWYFNHDSLKRFHDFPAFKELDAPHQLVHLHARSAAEAYAAGDIPLAEQHLTALEQASKQVIGLIDELIRQLAEG